MGEKVGRLFGAPSSKEMAALRDAQTRQAAAIDKERTDLEAKETALRRLFRGRAGATLASNDSGLASVLG